VTEETVSRQGDTDQEGTAGPGQGGPGGTGGPGGNGGTGSPPMRRGGLGGIAPPAVKWRAIFFGLAAFGILTGVVWALLGSRLLVVRSVVVHGTRLVPSAEVTAVADVPDGTPLIRVNDSAVAQRVEGIRDVAQASVTKNWPSTLVITVTERAPVVAVKMAQGYDLLDASGVIVRWTGSKPAALPVYETALSGSALRGNPDLAAAAAVLRGLPRWLASSVLSVSAPDPEQVTLRVRGHVTIVWGSDTRDRQKAAELSVLMRTQRGRYYDVSSPGTVVVR
jgi:cell division protein FtsQ